MLLTKTWSAILAVLATACLAGMYLLSLGNAGGFSDADRAAIRATTEAGLAALEAEIQSSPVQRAPALLGDRRLKEALDLPPDVGQAQGAPTTSSVLADVAEESLLSDNPQMTVGIVDAEGKVLATSGIQEQLVTEIGASPALAAAPGSREALFTATLGGKVHVVKASRADSSERRLVAIQGLDIGAGSLLRRVLGTKNPAGLVRGGKLLGDVIGDQPVASEIETMGIERGDAAPDEGASEVFTIGSGLNARIGAVGRVPGPAGRGPTGTMLIVLSRNTAAAGQQDLAEALRRAKSEGLVKRLPFPLLIGLLVVSIGLALYLPSLEALGPMRRLAGEFNGVAQGTQHQIFHDRYGGVPAELARAAASAHDALRNAYLAELEGDGFEDPDDAGDEGPTRPRKGKSAEEHRASKVKPIELPTEDIDGEVETSAAPGADEPGPSAAKPAASPAGDAPLLTDEVASDDVAKSLAFDSPSPATAAKPSAGATFTDNTPASAGITEPATPADPKEAYFREIFDEFVQTKLACGESTAGFTFEKFARKLARNTEELVKRPGISDVKFSVYVKDGKAALKAKVIKE